MEISYKTLKNILLISILILVILSISQVLHAAAIPDIKFTPQVGIGTEIEVGIGIPVSGRTFADYIVAIYNWSIRAIVLLAIVMIMIAGSRWMWAGGNVATITQARKQIISALIGLLLAVGSYTLLNLINPSLVRFTNLEIEGIKKERLGIKCEDAQICVYEAGGYEEQCQCVSDLKIWTNVVGEPTNQFFRIDKNIECGRRKAIAYILGSKCPPKQDCVMKKGYYFYIDENDKRLYNDEPVLKDVECTSFE